MGVYSSILTGVKNLVASIPGLSTSGQVVIRKRPAFVRAVDTTLPLVCVCPTVERLNDYTFLNESWLDYPVLIALITESALALHSPDTILDLRETIRKKLMVTLITGASSVFDLADYSPEPAFDHSGFDAAMDVSVQEFVYRSSDTRNA